MLISQSEVAARAGVSQATVSLALRNHPSLPKNTRLRVQAIAESLGYRPDPALVALSHHRQKLKTPSFHGLIGFLVSDVMHQEWKSEQACWRLFEGAKEAGAALGYQLEFAEFTKSTGQQSALASVWKARGLRGLIVMNSPYHFDDLRNLTEKFKSVPVFTEPTVSGHQTVVSNHFEAMRRICLELYALGYRRPCFAITRRFYDFIWDGWRGAFYVESERRFAGKAQIHISETKSVLDDDSFFPWASEQKFDSLIFCCGENVLPGLLSRGLKIPDQIGVCCLDLRDPVSSVSGMYQDWWQIGSTAAKLLHSQLISDGDGSASTAISVQIAPTWNPGTTLRAISKEIP